VEDEDKEGDEENERDTGESLRMESKEPYQERRSPRLSKKPTSYDPQKGYIAITNQEIDPLATNINLVETKPQPTSIGFAYKAADLETGELNEYSKLAKSSDVPL
jgi:hypothetical protein